MRPGELTPQSIEAGFEKHGFVSTGEVSTSLHDPLAWALGDLASACRAVLWLVPERRASWGTGDSALAYYLPHADVVVEAWNLAGLADGLEALLRRL